jgi:YfiH family protein
MILDWPTISGVRACMTERQGGVSLAPRDTMNLGNHVGDDPQAVARNRQLLAQNLGARPVFMEQVHGTAVLALERGTPDGLQADACWTQQPGLACTVMVADCLPVLLCDEQGHWVAAAHAGWRGLAGMQGQGVLESLWQQLQIQGAVASRTCAWLGPCIGPLAFEVGAEVREAFVQDGLALDAFFTPQADGRFLADLAGLARSRLQQLGIERIGGNASQPEWCTVAQPSRFFSHRRDSRVLGSTGRMAACIWLGR